VVGDDKVHFSRSGSRICFYCPQDTPLLLPIHIAVSDLICASLCTAEMIYAETVSLITDRSSRVFRECEVIFGIHKNI
jgi:hypothetical protein